jgi:hypothetical protein
MSCWLTQNLLDFLDIVRLSSKMLLQSFVVPAHTRLLLSLHILLVDHLLMVQKLLWEDLLLALQLIWLLPLQSWIKFSLAVQNYRY